MRYFVSFAFACLVFFAALTIAVSNQTPALAFQATTIPFTPAPPIPPTPTTALLPTETIPPTPTPSGQVLVVNKLDDTNDRNCDSNDCSLREAVDQASWGATIKFLPSLTGMLKLREWIQITKSLTIIGPSTKSTQLVLTSTGSIFTVAGNIGQMVSITGLTFASATGGAIDNAGTMVIANCTFSDNQGMGGGAISNSGTLMVTNSTFYGNLARITEGGAIYSIGTLAVSNSTFYGNTAYKGGAIAANGKSQITYSTFKNNNLDSGSSSIKGTKDTVIKASIIESNSKSLNCEGLITDGGDNLQWPAPSTLNDLQANCVGIPVGDPKLGPLQDNGGPTFTMAIQTGSAATGKISSSKCPKEDQRGFALTLKGSNAKCDIGAFQIIVTLPTTTPVPSVPSSKS